MGNWMQVTIDDGELRKAVKKHMDSLLAEFGGYDGLREMVDQRRRLYDALEAVEWHNGYCPWCLAFDSQGHPDHKPDCQRQGALGEVK